MNDRPDLEPERDPALEERFRELRNHDARRAPSFTAIARRPKRRARWLAGGGAAAALALAAAIALGVGSRAAPPRRPPIESVPNVTFVQLDPAPLDFLLAPPKSPSFDVVPVPEQPR